MKIIKAKAMGMCFGVKDALSSIFKIKNSAEHTLYGELVHNKSVMENIKNMGFEILDESQRKHVPQTNKVIITAHGLSNKNKTALENQGKTLVDTTCPLVKKIHNQALYYESKGYMVVILGKKSHVEVQGIVDDLRKSYVVECIEDIKQYDERKLAVLCQSTSSKDKVNKLLYEIQKKNRGVEIKFINTICKPTLDRQSAVEELIKEVDALVVVGGRNSNNTIQLAKKAITRGVKAFHVEKSEELQFDDLAHYEKIGLTAGSSTPDSIIENAYHKLLSFAKKKNLQKI